MSKKTQCGSGKHVYPIQPLDWSPCPYCRLEYIESQDLGKLLAVRDAANYALNTIFGSGSSIGGWFGALRDLDKAVRASQEVDRGPR